MKYYLLLIPLLIFTCITCKDQEQLNRQKLEKQVHFFLDTAYVPIYSVRNSEISTGTTNTLFVRSISTNDTIMIQKISMHNENNIEIGIIADMDPLLPMNNLKYKIIDKEESSHLLVSYKIRNDRKPIIDLITFDEKTEGKVSQITHGTVLSRKRKNWALGLSNYKKSKELKNKNQ